MHGGRHAIACIRSTAPWRTAPPSTKDSATPSRPTPAPNEAPTMKTTTLTVSLFAALAGACATAQDDRAAKPTIVQIAADAGTFHTLVAAVKAAGLAETLSGPGPFTVFAPTDAAFAKLGKDTIATLLKPENKDKLAAILKHHVVAGAVPAAAAMKLDEATALDGTKLALKKSATGLTVGGANVVTTDVLAGNGVIHVVDAVILPASN